MANMTTANMTTANMTTVNMTTANMRTGDVHRDKGSKMRPIVTLGNGSITNLHFRHASKLCHLFATTLDKVYCLNCSKKDSETTVSLRENKLIKFF